MQNLVVNYILTDIYHIYIYIHTYYIYIYLFTFLFIFLLLHIHVIYMCMLLYTYICTCIHIYNIYIYKYIRIWKFRYKSNSGTSLWWHSLCICKYLYKELTVWHCWVHFPFLRSHTTNSKVSSEAVWLSIQWTLYKFHLSRPKDTNQSQEILCLLQTRSSKQMLGSWCV